MAGLGSVSVFLTANIKDFRTKMQMAQKSFKRLGGQMTKVGRGMTRNLTMPLGLVGVASVKMATDFDTSMRKINTLVGVSKGEVENFKDEILDLAGETAQSPVALADGLFFLTSAGLEGANAIETLTAVAKANTAGLGDQTSLAKFAAAAQNAYGEANLTAADSLDTFGKMVKTGMFEADELADGLGSLMGLSSSLSVEIDELGAFIATYTKTTGDANLAMTGVNAVMMSFAKVTPKGEKALNKIGLTGESVREMLSEKGLQGTLMHLQEAFQAQGIPMTEFFSKGNAIKGVLGVLGNQTETYTNVLDDMQETQGFVNDAFDETAQGPGFQFQQLLAQLKVVGIQLGEALLPVVLQMVAKFQALAEKFTALSPQTKDIIVKVGLLVAAAGPLLLALGSIISVLPAIGTAMSALLGPVGLVVGALAIAAVAIVKNWDKIRTYFTEGDGSKMFDTIKQIVVTTMDVVARVVGAAGEFIAAVWAKIGPFVMDIVGKVFNTVGSIIQRALNLILKILNFFIDIFTGNWDKVWNSIKTTFKKIFDGVVEFFLSGILLILKGMGKLVEKLGLEKLTNKVNNLRTSISTYKDSLGDIPNQNSSVKTSNDDLNESFETSTKNLDDIKGSTIDLTKEKENLNKVTGEQNKALSDEEKKSREAHQAFLDNLAAVDDLAVSKSRLGEEYDANAEKQKLIKAEIERLIPLYGENSQLVKKLEQQYLSLNTAQTSESQIIANKAKAYAKMGVEFDEIGARQDNLKTEIDALISQGFDPAEGALKDLIDEYKRLGKESETTTERMSKGLQKFADTAGQILSSVGAVFSQYFEMKMQQIENEQAAEEEALEKEFQRQMEDIEGSTMNQQMKDEKMQELQEAHDDNMSSVQEKFADKMNQQKRKQAIADKAMSVASAIINTASGVSSALALGPPGIPLAGIIGGLGLAQIALIMSTPIPAMAQGGIVTGPTTALIGEAGAEAVIPLDKLGNMMGDNTVNVVGKISGDDIVLVSDRARQNKTRVRGINS